MIPHRQFNIQNSTLKIIMILLCACSISCTRKVYVPVQSTIHHIDTIHSTRHTTDTIRDIRHIYERDYRLDSIAPILDSLGRVIGWDRHHFRELTKMDQQLIARMQATIDSLQQIAADTIYRELPVPADNIQHSTSKITKVPFYYRLLSAIGVISLFAGSLILLARYLKRRYIGG